MQDLKARYLAEKRGNFAAQWLDFYSKHRDHGLIESLRRSIASLQPISKSEARKLMAVGNRRIVDIIDNFQRTFGTLPVPSMGDYLIAEKECVDARTQTGFITDLLANPRIHHRTAGAGVTDGSVFLALEPELGVGFIKTHFGCGGEDMAYRAHRGTLNPDHDAASLIRTIPYAIAHIPDEVQRCEFNARAQVLSASAIVAANRRGNEIHPVMLTWADWPKVDVVWLSVTQTQEHPFVQKMRESMKVLWALVAEYGGSPNSQSSHTILLYDSERLGRFSGPRLTMDALPNELFCVTDNFSRVENGSDLSSTAVASLRFAAFIDGGHVFGVGQGGNKHIMILDRDINVVRLVKRKLLEASADIRDGTNNGETITEATQNIETGAIEFVNSS